MSWSGEGRKMNELETDSNMVERNFQFQELPQYLNKFLFRCLYCAFLVPNH